MTATAQPASDDVVTEPVAVLKHRRGNRWMHWINFPFLFIMIWSGLRIYWSNDIYAIGSFELFPDAFNELLGLERRLAKGMAFHFTFGWLFALNGIAYLIYLWRTGGWRQIVPDRESLKESFQVLLHDLHIRKQAPVQGKYNAAQRLTYTAVIVMGALIVISGFAIYKPVQLSWLTAIFGGYEGARLVHFSVTMGFVLFFALHVFQVSRAGWSNFASMVTGYELRKDRERG